MKKVKPAVGFTFWRVNKKDARLEARDRFRDSSLVRGTDLGPATLQKSAETNLGL